MHKLAAALLALPVLAFVYLSALLHRSILARLGVLALAVVLVVAGLVVGLPERQVSAKGPTSFAPLSQPSFKQPTILSNLPLGDPIQVEFSKSMDAASVAANLKIDPAAEVKLTWDAEGKIVSIGPASHWAAGTYYTVDIDGAARDRDGLGLGQPIHTGFTTQLPTKGTITASIASSDSVAPGTAFRVTFDRAVKIATVKSLLQFTPAITGGVLGDDPTDADSHVFTFIPYDNLAAGATYTVAFGTGGTDAEGYELAPIAPLTVKTLSGPAVVRFRPRDKTIEAEATTSLSVRFTTPMDTGATAAAFTATADGTPITGTTSWAEDDTVLVLDPTDRLPAGAKIVMTVSSSARSVQGITLTAPASAWFVVKKGPAAPAPQAPAATATPSKPSTPSKPTVKPIKPGSGSLAQAPWYSTETYYLSLMNCTRTGGWVTSSGGCSSSGRHTLPAARALFIDAGISSKVSRPYAKYMADRNILTHFADGNPGTRLRRAGYTSYHWGENIGASGALHMHLYFQSESPCRCNHYKNMMDPQFDRAGIGVWITGSRWRIAIDFYHP